MGKFLLSSGVMVGVYYPSRTNTTTIMNNQKWVTTQKSATVLSLDPKNPRLAQISGQATERELLAELVSKEDVHGIAKSIVENGYFPNEVLVAVREGKKLIIAEGNCRLAACKLLISPEAAPTSFQSKFRILAAKANLSQLKAIPVSIAPSREATFPILLTRHTKPPVSMWDPAMQSKFYKQVIDAGWSIPQISTASGQPESRVREDLRDYHLYEMACRLDLPAGVAETVRNPHKFPLSTLGRIFGRSEARHFFGIEVNDNGEVVGIVPEAEFIKGFEKVVTDVAKGEKTSRTLNTTSDIVNYLGKFPAANTPDTKKKGKFTAASFRKGASSPVAVKPTVKPRRPVRGPTGLIPNTVACNVANQRVIHVFDELRHLSPEKFPNACAVLLRSFLELSVHCYLDSKGQINAMAAEYQAELTAWNTNNPQKPPRKMPTDWTPTLEKMMNRLLDPSKALLPPGHLTKALPKILHDEQQLFAFNLCVHNSTYHPDDRQLRASWARLEELMKAILA